jgi:alanine racemase
MIDEAWAGAILTIDLDAVAANWRLLRDRAAPAACAAVVKADAYGLGATRVAQRLYVEGCRSFFVAHLSEGAALRPRLPADAAIHVLNGAPAGAEADTVGLGLIPVLNAPQQIAAWRSAARAAGRALPAALHVDTGMARLGLAPAETDALAADPTALDGVNLTLVMSHLACADAPDHPANARQLTRFRAARALFPAARASFANSSGLFLGPEYRFDLARPGAALYGIAPQSGPNPMRAVVRLQARVIQTRDLPAGEPVGYGCSWTAQAPARIATIAVGYADGWLRSASERGAATFKGARLPFAGRVSMDLITLDVSALPADALRPGDLVDLLDPRSGVDAAAEAAGTIGYEILTALGARYARRYLGG